MWFGVSFHVGEYYTIHMGYPIQEKTAKHSRFQEPAPRTPVSFAKAIKHAHLIFTQARHLGFTPTILDIGGGSQDTNFEPTAGGITTIAEPGRFYARCTYTLVCRVIARRRQLGSAAAAGVPDMLNQNDGVYGNFMNVITEQEVMQPCLVLTKQQQKRESDCESEYQSQSQSKCEAEGVVARGQQRYSVWEPTGDSVDCVMRDTTIDGDVEVGNWLKYKDMGGMFSMFSTRSGWVMDSHCLTATAYTNTTATQFNGFKSARDVLYVNSETLPLYSKMAHR